MLLISLCVSNLCLFKERKNLTLKTCAPDFSACSMTKLYAKIKGARAISLFDFPKTWQVCSLCRKPFFVAGSLSRKQEIADSLGRSQI